VIRNVNLMTAEGPTIRNGMIAIADGKIVAIGPSVTVPAGATVIDGAGKYVTPGIIDTHSHLGVYAAPGVQALSDGILSLRMSGPSIRCGRRIRSFRVISREALPRSRFCLVPRT
jgi:imidazolonepropionase-like amidohydrolase